MTIRIILVGGFLGAGKTTLLASAARALKARGLRAAVITNDQSGSLVDTALIREQAIPVAEVTNGCFCCQFPSLLDAIYSLVESEAPDVILAEPVGSCTDLMATVIRPLQTYHNTEFEVAPLTVLFDPARDPQAFPELVGYLYEKQLDEADILILSKADLLPLEERPDRLSALQRTYPSKTMLALSSMTGQGLDAWLDLCLAQTSPAANSLPLDYQLYAEAEAALGWLNASGTLSADSDFSPQAWLSVLLEGLRETFAAEAMQVAHLKAYAQNSNSIWKASLTGSNAPSISWDRRSTAQVRSAAFILNVRANGSPARIEAIVHQLLHEVGETQQVHAEVTTLDCFSPAPPKPVYRLLIG